MRENTICVCLFALVFCSGELPTFVKRAKRGSGQGAGGVTGFTDGELGHAYICKYNHYAGPFSNLQSNLPLLSKLWTIRFHKKGLPVMIIQTDRQIEK